MQIFVSVIIPTYKDWARLKLCLDALAQQSFAADSFEVIIVNNDPDDSCPYLLPSCNMRIIKETKPGSYAARNVGIQAAKGELLTFTDSDCIPAPEWLAAGVQCLKTRKCDLIGGHVDFFFKNPSSAAEILDTMGNMDNHRRIPRHGCAATANLFVRKDVFDAIGLFDDSMMSGGDTEFTQRATGKGLSLQYCPGAIVNHPTRNFLQGLKKSYRVGKGLFTLEMKRSASMFKKLKITLIRLLPLPANPLRIRKKMLSYKQRSFLLFVKAVMISLLFRVARIVGFFQALLSYVFRNQ